MLIARLLSAAAETDTELVAAPAAGIRIEILGLFIDSDGANTVSLYEDDGATLLHRHIGAAEKDVTLPPGAQPWDVLTAAKNLTVTSTAAVGMFIKVVYRIVSAV